MNKLISIFFVVLASLLPLSAEVVSEFHDDFIVFSLADTSQIVSSDFENDFSAFDISTTTGTDESTTTTVPVTTTSTSTESTSSTVPVTTTSTSTESTSSTVPVTTTSTFTESTSSTVPVTTSTQSFPPNTEYGLCTSLHGCCQTTTGSCLVNDGSLSMNSNDSWCNGPSMQVFNKTGSLTSTVCLIFDAGCYYQFVAISESNNTFSGEIKVIPNSGEYLIYNSVALLCNTTNQKCNYSGLSIEIQASQCYNSGLSVQISDYQSLFLTCLVSAGDGTYRQNMLANHVSETDFISACKSNPVVSSATRTVSFWW